MTSLRTLYRRSRVRVKQLLLIEPLVPVRVRCALEFHGNDDCGWAIPCDSLGPDSIVVDVGLGEDISFSTSLIARYDCTVHGFDPTPRAVAYVKALAPQRFVLHDCGVGAGGGEATFYLPNEVSHVSGSIVKASHIGSRELRVSIVDMAELFALIRVERIALLKLDIEGAEYDLIGSQSFREHAARVDMICIEFHHRWHDFGRKATQTAVSALEALGFRCAWGSATSNEEFLFINAARLQNG